MSLRIIHNGLRAHDFWVFFSPVFLMHDLLCVGLGPAACTTALYTTRYKMNVKMMGAQPGGQVSQSTEIENYTGIESILGRDLTKDMLQQVTKNGAEIVYDSAESIEKIEGGFRVKGSMSGEHEAKIILVSTGMEHRHLGVPGEKEFYGKGVTYCATCDGMFFKDRDVAIVGGGNTAAESALYLADICTSVRVFVRKDHFRADPVLVEKVMTNPKIIVEFETQLSEIQGEEKLSRVFLNTGETRDIQGLFIEIGSDPRNDLAKTIGVECNDQGYVVVDSKQRTNIPNILAAGDNTTGSDTFAQIATAVGEGAVAAKTAYNLFQHF